MVGLFSQMRCDGCGEKINNHADTTRAAHRTDYKKHVSKSGPRTRVRRLWLLHLSPDPIHASPLREPLSDTYGTYLHLPAATKLVKALSLYLALNCYPA